jgi:hypothetical protein
MASESASGTKRTSSDVRVVSAIGDTPDVAFRGIPRQNALIRTPADICPYHNRWYN